MPVLQSTFPLDRNDFLGMKHQALFGPDHGCCKTALGLVLTLLVPGPRIPEVENGSSERRSSIVAEEIRTHIFHYSFLRAHYITILKHMLREIDSHSLFCLYLHYRPLKLGTHRLIRCQ